MHNSRRQFVATIGMGLVGALSVNAQEGKLFAPRSRKRVSFVHDEIASGADVDVLDARGQRLFRVLLPEAVTATNIAVESFLSHVTPGRWGYIDDIHWGVVSNPDWVEVRVALSGGTQGTLALMCLKNLSQRVLESVQIDVCVSVSHLPNPHGNWINARFLDVMPPYDRGEAGRFWYERVAPTRLRAYVDGQWMIAHAHPGSPSSAGVPSYQPFRYLREPASIMAVESLDGENRLFQAWDTPCDVRCAFPGNSCMHLLPKIARVLAPGETACIRGEIAVTGESWSWISRWKPRRHHSTYATMRAVLDAALPE